MTRYRLSKLADQDFADILRYTIQNWGIKQGATYLQLLIAARNHILNNPFLPGSKYREDLARNCRAFRAAKHVIFYRVNRDTLEIARILHESMDFSRHIDEQAFD